ncbi:unnamed protein product [Clavelina lepadiformis]|uniref:Uncharacterized protein n=1 Tax=Clavelina lepadiformis TaxID=159417 RepID=A0ABP0H312_CLALP
MTTDRFIDMGNDHPFGESIYFLAAALDPRFKMQWLVDVNYTDDNKENIRSKVEDCTLLETESVIEEC